MRPFSEAARLTADYVQENEKGQMRIAFGRNHKTGKKTARRRYIYVPANVASRIRELMTLRPKGSGLPLIAAAQGKTWKQKNAPLQFKRLATTINLEQRLRAKFGEEFSDAVLYSCRHTFAARMIPKVGLARTAALMGNTVKICERNYGHLDCLHEAMFDDIG